MEEMNWISKLLVSSAIVFIASLVCGVMWQRRPRTQEDDRPPQIRRAYLAAALGLTVSGLVTLGSLILLVWFGGCTSPQ